MGFYTPSVCAQLAVKLEESRTFAHRKVSLASQASIPASFTADQLVEMTAQVLPLTESGTEIYLDEKNNAFLVIDMEETWIGSSRYNANVSTKDRTEQQILDDICYSMNLEAISAYMKEVDWVWASAVDRTPSVVELRAQLRNMLRIMLDPRKDFSHTGTGGFHMLRVYADEILVIFSEFETSVYNHELIH